MSSDQLAGVAKQLSTVSAQITRVENRMTDLESEIKNSKGGGDGPEVTRKTIDDAKTAQRHTHEVLTRLSAALEDIESEMVYVGPAIQGTHEMVVNEILPSLTVIKDLFKKKFVRAVGNVDYTAAVKAQQFVDTVACHLAAGHIPTAEDILRAEGTENASGSAADYVLSKAEVLDALARWESNATRYTIMEDVRSLIAAEIRPTLDSIKEHLARRDGEKNETLPAHCGNESGGPAAAQDPKPTYQAPHSGSVSQAIRSLVAEEIRPTLDSVAERVAGCEAEIKSTLARAAEELRQAAAAHTQAACLAASVSAPSASRTDGDSVSTSSASIRSWAIQSYGTGSLAGADDW